MRPLLIFVMLVLVAGCGGNDEQAASGAPPLEGTPWVLVSGIDVAGWEKVAPSANFADGRLAGSSGCNRYMTSYDELDGEALKLGQVAGSKVACTPPAGDVERAYLAALARVEAWRTDGKELVLLDGDDGELLRFRTPSPVGSWKATMFLHPGAVKSLLAGTEITAVFEDGGKLSGSAGCNTYTGTWSATAITDVSATEKACPEPAGVMQQEQAYLAALTQTAGYTFEGTSLTLLTRDGTIVATYTAAG